MLIILGTSRWSVEDVHLIKMVAVRPVVVFVYNYIEWRRRCGDLLISAFIPRSSGLCSSLGWRHFIVFLSKTLNTHMQASLHPGV